MSDLVNNNRLLELSDEELYDVLRQHAADLGAAWFPMDLDPTEAEIKRLMTQKTIVGADSAPTMVGNGVSH